MVAQKKVLPILVVDDEPAILRMIGRVLVETGCPILTATNGADALQIVEAEGPEVVVTDIRMPGMDGIELTRRIKSDHPDTAVILMSAFREPDNHAADGFIPKPFDNDDLLDSVVSLIQAKSS